APLAWRRHPPQQPGHDDRLDRRQPVDQAGQPHAALQDAFRSRVAGIGGLPGRAEMRSETGFDPALYDRFPTNGERPPEELRELERIWCAPKGWQLLTAVNNNYVGFFYVATAF